MTAGGELMTARDTATGTNDQAQARHGFDDFLALTTLHARFDALAEGRSVGDSSAAHQAVLDRLAANWRLAEAAGWTDHALERLGGTGRLNLWGAPPSGQRRELVPDWLPAQQLELTTSERSPRLPPNGDQNQARFNKLKAGIRQRVRRFSPTLSENVFERLVTRMATVELKYDALAPSAGPRQPAEERAGVEVADPTSKSEMRWLDDGGQ